MAGPTYALRSMGPFYLFLIKKKIYSVIVVLKLFKAVKGTTLEGALYICITVVHFCVIKLHCVVCTNI